MNSTSNRTTGYLLLVAVAVALGACGQPQSTQEAAPESAPAAPAAEADAATTNLYWGDTHLHTEYSFDAGSFGNRLGPEEAYVFAKGGAVQSSNGVDADGNPLMAQLHEPLDFIVVSDHSDGLGFFQEVLEGSERVLANPETKRWSEMINSGGADAVDATIEMIGRFSQDDMPINPNNPEVMRKVWDSIVANAEENNEPGKFTAFIGYEWTSLVGGNNLHRVVIFKDGADKAGKLLPYTMGDSPDPEDLWQYMADYEAQSGGDVLAIPHNGNLSNGIMFDVETLSGGEITREYAETRQKWEPIYESTQIKGDGEAHPLLSPDDEFADYETWAFGNLDVSVAKTPDMLPGEYMRSALKRGLEFEDKLGVNPYKYGQIGSTDSHTSLATAEENNFFGKHSGAEPGPERTKHALFDTENGTIMYHEMTSSGYAAVWAEENTREAIFDAMMRRETYATTGSRIQVRMFGGFGFDGTESDADLFAADGYAKGVPMGGDLSGGDDKAPTFLVAAIKDKRSGNLDRVQVIKGWLDANGESQERIYDVAVSDDRPIDADGRCRVPVGNTVNVANASWTDSIGAEKLSAVWTDPDFDAAERAFYYVRVIEIPTPRWTAFEAKTYNLDLPDDVEMTTQERAYTSPIWYTP